MTYKNYQDTYCVRDQGNDNDGHVGVCSHKPKYRFLECVGIGSTCGKQQYTREPVMPDVDYVRSHIWEVPGNCDLNVPKYAESRGCISSLCENSVTPQ